MTFLERTCVFSAVPTARTFSGLFFIICSLSCEDARVNMRKRIHLGRIMRKQIFLDAVNLLT